MRLINVDTLGFEDFFDDNIPPYAILSHRWTEDEITYKDYLKNRRKHSQGYLKVHGLVHATRRYNEWLSSTKAALQQYNHENYLHHRSEGSSRPPPRLQLPSIPSHIRSALSRLRLLHHVWIDTCCIDKRSSAELSEAINAMFDWYSKAQVCFVHLGDVTISRDEPTDLDVAALLGSIWFSRGWTLQELLSPAYVLFCDREWRYVAHKCPAERSDHCLLLPGTQHINHALVRALDIEEIMIRAPARLRDVSAAQVFSWV